MSNLSNLKGQFNYCMHGLGAISGLRQTNTLEAFEKWYKKGIRVFEFDIAMTVDKKFVAVAHSVDKKSMLRVEVLNQPQQYTYDWFMSQELFKFTAGGLTPLSLYDIISLLHKYSDVVFMLDLFGLFDSDSITIFLSELDSILHDFPSKITDSLLLEAYNTVMSDCIYLHNDKYNIIYCARYEATVNDDNSISLNYLKSKNIDFVSYPWVYTKMHPGELENYSKNGITVFSRTKYNSKCKILKSSGVSVNIIANRFDGMMIVLQYPLYFICCLKRLLSKIIVKIFQK